ncbi:CDP-diacylglycerol--glycerol-3-phosphate 3-phosphatidyltransferase [Candidatus Dependentiae bacterium]|nr:CDP-diacylglycerol--glycerol-3-phosphate 3-phosphatidyltransferase [Candidatus Dependentiae bacterium]
MKNIFTFPNILTFCRILFTPIFIFLFLLGGQYLLWSIIVFTLAAISDFCDGYFARYLKIKSKFGSFFDPLADKILIISTFFTFYFVGIIHLWVILIIVFRDLVVTFLRLYLVKREKPLQTSYLAKSKTVIQFIAIYICFIFLILNFYFDFKHLKVYLDYFMYFVALVTLWSGIDYLVKNKKAIKCLF